jgi:hypothetical protein
MNKNDLTKLYEDLKTMTGGFFAWHLSVPEKILIGRLRKRMEKGIDPLPYVEENFSALDDLLKVLDKMTPSNKYLWRTPNEEQKEIYLRAKKLPNDLCVKIRKRIDELDHVPTAGEWVKIMDEEENLVRG